MVAVGCVVGWSVAGFVSTLAGYMPPATLARPVGDWDRQLLQPKRSAFDKDVSSRAGARIANLRCACFDVIFLAGSGSLNAVLAVCWLDAGQLLCDRRGASANRQD